MNRWSLPVLLGLCLGGVAPSPGHAAPPGPRASLGDLAELFPASTLGYLELKHPPLIREVFALIKGSGLEDYAAFRDEHTKVADRAPTWFGSSGAMLAFVFTPEFLDELARFNQHGVGVVGFNKDGPRFVWVMDAGDSNIPNLITRDVLTLVDHFDIVARVEGVRLYQYLTDADPTPAPPDGTGKKEPQPTHTPPVIALLPHVVVLGSDVEAVSQVIRRIKKKDAGPSLTSVKAFQDGADLRRKPGMFAYAALEKLFGPKGAIVSGGAAPWAFDTFFGAEDIFMHAALTCDPQSVKTAVAYYGLDKGTVELQVRAHVDPARTSPLSTILGSKPADLALMQAAPANSVGAVVLPLAGKPVSTVELFKRMNDIARAHGIENHPTEKGIKEIVEALKIDIGKEVLGRLKGMCLVQLKSWLGQGAPGPGDWMVLFEATDAAAAEKLEVIWDRYQESQPKEAKLGPLQRKGNMLVWAASKEDGAKALGAVGKDEGFASRPEVAGTLKELGDARLVGCWSVQAGLDDFLAQEREQAKKEIENCKKMPNKENAAKLARLQRYLRWVEQTATMMPTALKGLPAQELSVTSSDKEVTLRFRQAGLQPVAARLIDGYLIWDLISPQNWGGYAATKVAEPRKTETPKPPPVKPSEDPKPPVKPPVDKKDGK